ncbi:E3 ubiquitin-protein ligase TRIM45-like isoform X2 [Acropora palmata]|uniref:E3 ubiquitin-protein ligase TRIM45-like isoform X2 n=1 Tax=Acropora palmata TaxID=6131 RepID=UPI003D9FF34D
MASAVSEKLADYFECAVCMEQFKEPKVLPCLHTYCKMCLQELLKEQGSDYVINCPECRQEAKIAHGDVAKLQPNFWVNNFMTLLRMQDKDTTKPFPCENCDSEDEAVSRCKDCRVFMCDFCVTAHKRFRATRGHQMLSMAEVQKLGSKALSKPSFCVKHTGETLKLFCETCEETICRDCTIVDHREHKYNFVADVAEREREVLHILLNKAKGKEVVVANGLETVYAMKELVQSRVSEVNNEVDEFFDEQVKALEYQRANLKREVMTEGKVRVDQLEKQSRVLSSFLAQLKSGVEFTSQALDDGDNVQLLTMKKQFSQRLTQLSSTKIDCKPCQNEYFKLCVRQTIWRNMKDLATVFFIINPQMFSVSIVGGEEGVMYRTLVGQTVSLVVTNKDREERGEYHVAASVAMTGEDEESLPTFGNNNGSHSFYFCPTSKGTVTLSVTVDGQPVGGSPFQWEVYPVLPICDEPKPKQVLPGGFQAMYGSRPYERGTTHGNCFKDGRKLCSHNKKKQKQKKKQNKKSAGKDQSSGDESASNNFEDNFESRSSLCGELRWLPTVLTVCTPEEG